VPNYANVSASGTPSASLVSTSSPSGTSSTSVTSHLLGPRLQLSPTNTVTTVTTTGNLNISNRSSQKRHSLTTLSPTWIPSLQVTNRHSMEVPVTSGSGPWSGSTTSSASTDTPVVKPSTRNILQVINQTLINTSQLSALLFAGKPRLSMIYK